MPVLKKEKIKEIMKCGKDPKYFINKYVKITHMSKGTIPFKLYDYQQKLIDTYVSKKRVVTLKSRQIGISWTTAAFVAWHIIFRPNKLVAVLSIKEEISKDFIEKVRFCIKSIPNWLTMGGIKNDNVKSIRMENGSEARATAAGSDVLRSGAFSILIVDEAAFVPGLADAWKAISPTLSTGGRFFLISTPNGIGDAFHKVYTKAVEGENGFTPINLPWHVHPERGKNWLEETKKRDDLSDREAAQEYECSFLKSGGTIVSPEDLEKARKTCIHPIEKIGLKDSLWVFEKPIENIVYWIYADVARGDSEDYSAFHVMRDANDKMMQCAEFKLKIPTDKYGRFLVEIAKMYNDAIIVVEENGLGIATLNEIKNYPYPHFFCQKKRETAQDLKNKRFGYINYNIAESNGDFRLGFNASPQIKQIYPVLLEKAFRNQTVIINSERTIIELSTYVDNKGKAEAISDDYNDDLCTSLGMGLYMNEAVNRYLMANMDIGNMMISSLTKGVKKFNNVKIGDSKIGDIAGTTSGFGVTFGVGKSSQVTSRKVDGKIIKDPNLSWVLED